MNEKEFEARHRDILETLRAARGDCPGADDLLDWVEGALGGEEAEAIDRHVTLCSQCTAVVERARQPDPQVDEVSWQHTAQRLDARTAAWSPSRPRWRAAWLAAAATVAAAALILVFLPDERAPAPSDIALTRDAGITLLDPRGPVQSVDVFNWQGIPAPVTYRVEVGAVGGTDETTPLWQGVTTETRLRADDALLATLEARQALQWRVVVLDAEGHELGRSEWLQFKVE